MGISRPAETAANPAPDQRGAEAELTGGSLQTYGLCALAYVAGEFSAVSRFLPINSFDKGGPRVCGTRMQEVKICACFLI